MMTRIFLISNIALSFCAFVFYWSVDLLLVLRKLPVRVVRLRLIDIWAICLPIVYPNFVRTNIFATHISLRWQCILFDSNIALSSWTGSARWFFSTGSI